MIIGHQKQRQFLEGVAKSGKVPHALLFTGQEKLGKKTIAIEFVKLFFGKEIFSHPDFYFIEPINNEIQISQIRDLNWKLSLKPFSAPLKAAIIDKAHLMNQEAQNCFLKTLEEPKGRAVLILVTEYPERLYSTIISRCEILKFHSVPKEDMGNYIKEKGISDQDSKELIEISKGRPGIIEDFLSDKEKLGEQRQIIKDLRKIMESDLAYRFQYAKDLSEKDDIKETLESWLDFLRNILINQINSSEKNSIISNFSLFKLKNTIQQILNINFLIDTTNVNKKLALEILMLEL